MVYLRKQGFSVVTHDVDEVTLVEMKVGMRVPQALQACHTALVGPYLIEGHVPAADIRRLLAERPAVVGLAVPGMPAGSPGMEAEDGRRETYTVLTFDRTGKTGVFARY